MKPPKFSFKNGISFISGLLEQPKNRYTYKRKDPKVNRNDLCPCGSGKKFKKCCG